MKPYKKPKDLPEAVPHKSKKKIDKPWALEEQGNGGYLWMKRDPLKWYRTYHKFIDKEHAFNQINKNLRSLFFRSKDVNLRLVHISGEIILLEVRNNKIYEVKTKQL